MAALFDTSAVILLLRRRPPHAALPLIEAAKAEIMRGSAVLGVPTVPELIIGERSAEGADRLARLLESVTVVPISRDTATAAGHMGSFLAMIGAPVPVPDLLIAGIAVGLEIPLLTWDSDYARAKDHASRIETPHAGASHWRALELHAASRRADRKRSGRRGTATAAR